MTHLVKTTHSDKTMCNQFVFQLLRDDEQETTTSLENVTCKKCVDGVEEILRILKNNGVTSGTNVAAKTTDNP